MKLRLKKDLPGYKAGTEFTTDEWLKMFPYNDYLSEMHKAEWIEKIEEKIPTEKADNNIMKVKLKQPLPGLQSGSVIDFETWENIKSVFPWLTDEEVVEVENKKPKTYDEIQAENIKNEKNQYFLTSNGELKSEIVSNKLGFDINVPTEKAAKKVLALCKLLIIAEYYNEGWEPDWSDDNYQGKWHIMTYNSEIRFEYSCIKNRGQIFFKSEEAIKEAYENNKQIFHDYLGIEL